jgi:hypothetical protein
MRKTLIGMLALVVVFVVGAIGSQAQTAPSAARRDREARGSVAGSDVPVYRLVRDSRETWDQEARHRSGNTAVL